MDRPHADSQALRRFIDADGLPRAAHLDRRGQSPSAHAARAPERSSMTIAIGRLAAHPIHRHRQLPIRPLTTKPADHLDWARVAILGVAAGTYAGHAYFRVASADPVNRHNRLVGRLIQIDHDFLDEDVRSAVAWCAAAVLGAFQTAGKSCASAISASRSISGCDVMAVIQACDASARARRRVPGPYSTAIPAPAPQAAWSDRRLLTALGQRGLVRASSSSFAMAWRTSASAWTTCSDARIAASIACSETASRQLAGHRAVDANTADADTQAGTVGVIVSPALVAVGMARAHEP